MDFLSCSEKDEDVSFRRDRLDTMKTMNFKRSDEDLDDNDDVMFGVRPIRKDLFLSDGSTGRSDCGKHKRADIAMRYKMRQIEKVYRASVLFAGLDLLKRPKFVKRCEPDPESVVGALAVFAPGTEFSDVPNYIVVSDVTPDPLAEWTFRPRSCALGNGITGLCCGMDAVSWVPNRSDFYDEIERKTSLVSVVGEFRGILMVVSGPFPSEREPNPSVLSTIAIVPFVDPAVRDGWVDRFRSVKMEGLWNVDGVKTISFFSGWCEDKTGFSVPVCVFSRSVSQIEEGVDEIQF